jgi:ABC-type Fe3+/spermidine/putrescine transport system ATPase subunit
MTHAGDGREHAVELLAVDKAYGGSFAMKSVSFGVPVGSVFALLGPSGCGKTTTLKVIGGFERPDSGRVLVGGEDMTSAPPHRRPVNTVFQSYAIFPHLDVRGNVAFGLREERLRRREIDERVRDAIELVQLQGREHAKPRTLSGGQLQRVALARALVKRPKLLLLDEPLAALDLHLRREMQAYLRDLRDQTGATFLHVTHDQEEAFAMADLVGVMNAGLLDQVGSPEEIYRRPATRFVAGFLGTANLLPGEVATSLGGRTYDVRLANGHLLRAEAGTDVLTAGSAVTVVLRPEDLRVTTDRGVAADRPHLTGAVRTCNFTAGRRHLQIDIGGIGTVVTDVGKETEFAPGDAVVATTSPDAAWVIPAADERSAPSGSTPGKEQAWPLSSPVAN